MIFLSIPLCVLFYCLGGQINKLFRPIGVPLSIIVTYLLWHNHSVWYFIPSLWYAFTLTLGYGENSKLMRYFKDEQIVRIVLGISSALPVLITLVMTKNYFALIGFPIIVGVECLRLGSWGKIGKYDILPVDILRGLAVGLGISLALI